MWSEPYRAAHWALLLLVLWLGGLGGCSPAPDDRTPAEWVAEGEHAVVEEVVPAPGRPGVRFPVEPRLETVVLDDEHRPALVLPLGEAGAGNGARTSDRNSSWSPTWSWTVRVPEDGWLQVGLGAPGGHAVEGVIALRRGPTGGATREILEVIPPVPRAPEPGRAGGETAGRPRKAFGWADGGVDLSGHAGELVTLELSAHPTDGELPADRPPEVAWAPVSLSTRRAAAELVRDGRPNVLVILVDTLRFDHITPYGYERETSPRIQSLLADAGLVAEDAYSQAPWTLPSVVSYMTSRFPGEVLAGDPATFGIPEGVPALPEVLSELGYRTGGFFANPTLRATNGFERGFDTFYTPSSMAAIQAHADEINRRALPWLRAHRSEPFFLYLHYIDPHDPYWNPDLVQGRSPYFDDPGGISGRWVHGVYTGRLEVDDLERQIRHFTALYDTEIRFVDRAIGRLLESIPEEILAETLVVLTSDHGEELYDHGGWKHGHTLYEDQIHVPLIFRWDGRLRAGSRLPGTVRLVDLAPTLVSAAGGQAPASWQGVDLLPALTGERQLPRLAAFAQHLNAGPMRSAAVIGGEKLILFNREEPFQPRDDLQEHLYRIDLGRLERRELYDLKRDPKERHDLLGSSGPAGEAGQPTGDPPAVAGLDAAIQNHLHRSLRGVRAMVEALPSGGRLTGELRFAAPLEGALPLWLGPEDRLEAEDDLLRFEIVAEPITKGFLLPGEVPGLVEAELWLNGEPLSAGRLRYGPATPFTGRPLEPVAFDTVAYPSPGNLPGLRLWRYSGERPESPGVDPETRRSLEALGYIQ